MYLERVMYVVVGDDAVLISKVAGRLVLPGSTWRDCIVAQLI